MLSTELEQLQEEPSHLKERLQNRVNQLSSDVQALSHDLHSSKLEYLGVIGGIRSWCKEFGERHNMSIDFRSEGSRRLPAELGLTLLRITQEALNNALKYSGVRRAEVCLEDNSDNICLSIVDVGVGFDMERAAQSNGLGLTSMRERVRLLNGTISIDSKPNQGTRIYVRLPLPSEAISHRLAV